MTMQPEMRRCTAVRCQVQVKRKFLMCPKHWALVPENVQREVYSSLRAYNAGGSMKSYLLATYRAQLAVVEYEGIPYSASINEKIWALQASLGRGAK